MAITMGVPRRPLKKLVTVRLRISGGTRFLLVSVCHSPHLRCSHTWSGQIRGRWYLRGLWGFHQRALWSAKHTARCSSLDNPQLICRCNILNYSYSLFHFHQSCPYWSTLGTRGAQRVRSSSFQQIPSNRMERCPHTRVDTEQWERHIC